MTERVFALPDLGEGLEEAEISRWLVSEGDHVDLNQPLAEIETAKATVEVPSPFAGVIAKLHGAEGNTLKVGAPLVTFEVSETGDAAAVRTAATPAVRQLAKELRVDIEALTGSGPGGRVTRRDVERAAGGTGADVERLAVTPTRRTIAANLTRAYLVPQATTFRTVDCSEVESLRHELRVSPLPIVARALVEVIPAHPLLNATWTDDAILVHRRIGLGIATDSERGLVVPVVRDAAALGITAMAAEIGRLAEVARGGSLAPDDLSGCTITVTNTGSYGAEYGTPILSPGNAVTLGLGAIEPRALVVGGEAVARPACTLSLTFDHRILDGAEVGRAFGELVDILGDRARLRRLPQ